jgi:hypothetical protein
MPAIAGIPRGVQPRTTPGGLPGVVLNAAGGWGETPAAGRQPGCAGVTQPDSLPWNCGHSQRGVQLGPWCKDPLYAVNRPKVLRARSYPVAHSRRNHHQARAIRTAKAPGRLRPADSRSEGSNRTHEGPPIRLVMNAHYDEAALARIGSAPWTLPRSRPCPPCQSRHNTVASSLKTSPVASRARSAMARTASRGCSDLVS